MSECDCNTSCCKGPKLISTKLGFEDHMGTIKVRLGFGRKNYKIDPGLYYVGDPDDTSPVLVSANYKLTFDSLRKELGGLDCYLLILDTKGVNVWCAAGKGTFGTDEIVRRVGSTGLSDIVSHRTLILPQLGAPGVSAHDVKKRTGFDVVYGPVRASDLKAFLDADMQATDEMRTVRFTTRDRAVLTPVEFVSALKISVFVFGILFLANLIADDPFGIDDVAIYLGAVVIGTIVTPILLPIIPGRAFSMKGWILGAIWTIYAVWAFGWLQDDTVVAAGYLFLLPSLSAYFAMNFTGSSTYTSFSGVIKEMKVAVPFIIVTMVIGVILLFAGKVI